MPLQPTSKQRLHGYQNPLVKRHVRVEWAQEEGEDGVFEVLYVGQGLIRFKDAEGKCFWTPLSEVARMEDPN